MQKSYIPKALESELYEWIGLCSVRKTEDGVNKIWIKYLDWTIGEDILENVINKDTYNSKKIIRTYSSGHVFINNEKDKVFLITTSKNWKIQHQFTWWSPIEEENREVITKENWKYIFDLQKVNNNAKIRTKNRTWVTVLEEYNIKPIVDWILIETNEDNEIYYKLVCLIHFIVRKYDWILNFTWKEDTIEWKWYNINNLEDLEFIAPNIQIVTKKSLELI